LYTGQPPPYTPNAAPGYRQPPAQHNYPPPQQQQQQAYLQQSAYPQQQPMVYPTPAAQPIAVFDQGARFGGKTPSVPVR